MKDNYEQEERATIMEYEGGMSRHEAEAWAARQTEHNPPNVDAILKKTTEVKL